MTFLIDHHEPPEIDMLLQDLEIQRGDYNSSGSSSQVYPDYVVVGGDKLVGINRKQVGEWLSSSDKVIEQLQRELAGPCEHLVLLIEGVMKPIGHTAMMSYSFEWSRAKAFNDTHGTMPFTQRVYAVNPKHVQNEQTRLEFLGVQVVHTYSLSDSASKLIALHDMIIKGEPNNVLNRLIKSDVAVNALDPIERKLATDLIGIQGAGIGEEVGLTIARLGFKTIGDLFRFWDGNEQLCDTMVREKTGVRPRRIGVAAEKKLQGALGYE